jgi:hypothetical protein
MSHSEKDDCKCIACVIRRALEGAEVGATVIKEEPWMKLLTDEQLKEAIDDAKMLEKSPSADLAIMTLLAHLAQYSALSKITVSMIKKHDLKGMTPFGIEKIEKLKFTIKALVDTF